MKKERKKSATIRVFNIVLSYDTIRKDSELEQFSIELVTEINKLLRKQFPHELPQLTIETGTKKHLKIGVREHEDDEIDE